MAEEITNNSLDIYISFERLKVNDLVFFLQRFSTLAEKISEDYSIRSGNFLAEGQFPTLDIESIHTGDSIKFSLIEGWLPTFKSDRSHDIVIGVPKKYGIPLIIGWLILYTYNQYLDLKIKQQEIIKNEQEIQKGKQDIGTSELDRELKRLELNLKESEFTKLYLSKETGSIDIEQLEGKIPGAKSILLDTIKQVNTNHDFRDFQVNNVSIKQKNPDTQQ